MMTVTGANWWNAVIAAAGSLLASLMAGSYFRAPIDAEVKICDTRWLSRSSPLRF